MKPNRSFATLIAILFAAVFLGAITCAQAQTSALPPTAAPAAVAPAAPAAPVAAPAPAAPAAPAPAAPVEQPLAATAPRREDQPQAPAPQPQPAGAAPPGPSPFATRVTAALSALRGQGAAVAQLAERDQTITQLRSQLTERDQTIQRLTAENAQYRADHAALEASLRTLEGERANVRETVAALGFDQTRLPAQGSLEAAAENTIEGLQEKFKAEKDSDKRSEIAAQIIKLREKAA